MNPADYPEWAVAIERIAESGGPLLLVGAVDTGKSTFARLLSANLAGRGEIAAVIDSDLGQSEIGPPACVGLAVLAPPETDIARVKPSGLAFVGSTAPRGCMLEHVVAIRQMADLAQRKNPRVLILDTTGYIQGQPARRLKLAKAEVICARHVVAIQRKDECEHILKDLAGDSAREIHRVGVPAVVVRKPPAIRSQRRAARFAAYFEKTEIRMIPFDHAAFTHTWLNTAPPVAPNVCRFLSDCAGVRVRYAENGARFLGMVTDGPPRRDLSLIQEQFKPETIAVTPIDRLNQLLIGLSDGARLLGLGVVMNVDFARLVLEVQTPIRSIAAVRLVHFGIIRVRPDGKELGFLKPGDV